MTRCHPTASPKAPWTRTIAGLLRFLAGAGGDADAEAAKSAAQIAAPPARPRAHTRLLRLGDIFGHLSMVELSLAGARISLAKFSDRQAALPPIVERDVVDPDPGTGERVAEGLEDHPAEPLNDR